MDLIKTKGKPKQKLGCYACHEKGKVGWVGECEHIKK